MAGPAVDLDDLYDGTHLEQTAKYMLLVGFTLLIYDHLLTLNQEINYLWRSKFGLASAIVLVNRYLVPCVLAIDICELFGGPPSLLFCQIWTGLQSYISIASYMSIHVLVAMRVHALYGGRQSIRTALIVGVSLSAIISIAVATLGVITVTPLLIPSPHQCVSKIPPFIWATYLPSILFETCLFALTLSMAVSQLKEGQCITSLYRILYRDGILYFVAVFLCTSFTLIVWAVAPPPSILLARYFSHALIVIAGSRLVLNLKVYAAERHSYDDLDLTIQETLSFRIPDMYLSQSPNRQSTLASSDRDYERAW